MCRSFLVGCKPICQFFLKNLKNIFYFYSFTRIYSLYRMDSLWQFWIGLHYTLIRLPPPSPPTTLFPALLKTIVRGFIILFYICTWHSSTIFPCLHLLHFPSSFPKYPPPFVNSCYHFLSYWSPVQKDVAYVFILKCFPVVVSSLMLKFFFFKSSWVLMAHACSLSYLGDQEDCGLWPTQANSLWDTHLNQ
jgi:hypothetical protein